MGRPVALRRPFQPLPQLPPGPSALDPADMDITKILNPQLLRAIRRCGIIRPSDVQKECLPQATLGRDILCQGKSGTGKTMVFVLATLQQIEATETGVRVLVLCNTRELAEQTSKEYEKITRFIPGVKVGVFFGGLPVKGNIDLLKASIPHIVVGTPGRILALVRSQHLDLSHLRHFVLDECDKMLETLPMRQDIQEVFVSSRRDKQVMMFSATFSPAIREVCKKFMRDPLESYVDENKLALHELKHYVIQIKEPEKIRKLVDLLRFFLDKYDKVFVFVNAVSRCSALTAFLQADTVFPVREINGGMAQQTRLANYRHFQASKKCVLVSTDVFGRGMDIQDGKVVVNFDMAYDTDCYLHRVGRAGRFETSGVVVTMVDTDSDQRVMGQVGERFGLKVETLPDVFRVMVSENEE